LFAAAAVILGVATTAVAAVAVTIIAANKGQKESLSGNRASHKDV